MASGMFGQAQPLGWVPVIDLGGLTRRSGMPPTVIWLSISGFFVALGFGVMIPVLPLFAREFGVSNLEIGLVISAFALMRLVTAPVCPWISDRLGHRNTIGIGMFWVAFSSVMTGLAHTYLELLIWRAVGGIGSAMFTVSALALLVASVPRHQRGQASGLWQGGFLLGGMAGPAIGGLLGGISLNAPFFFYAATLLVSGTIAILTLHDPPPLDEEVSEAVGSAKPVREVLRDVRYQAAAWLNFCTGWQSFGVRSALVPVLIVGGLGAPTQWTGLAFAIAAVAQTLALIPIGRATDRIGRREVMIGGALVAALATLALPFAPNLWLLVFALCVVGVASAALGTGPTAAVGDAAKGAGSKPIAWYSMAGDVGTIAGPLVAGGLADRWSMGVAFAAGSLLLLAGAAWSARMPRERPAAPLTGSD